MSPAFVTPHPHLVRPRNAPVLRLAPARRAPLARTQRAPMRAQLGATVNDLPAEPIPEKVAEIPLHWSRPGVYGVYDEAGELQYVAAAEHVGNAIAAHMVVLKSREKLYSVRMLTVDHPDDAPLGEVAENWVMAHFLHGPGVPPGNSDEEPAWRLEMPRATPDVYLVPGTPMEFIDMEIRRVLRDHRIVLFMKGTRAEPRCGFSKRVLEILEDAAGNLFKCVDCLDEVRNTNLREGIKKFSEWPTIPQLYVDGDFVGGTDIVEEMAANGELAKLLEPVLRAPAPDVPRNI